MAHQTHALPWNNLASNFKYGISYHSHPQRLDIHPLKKANQAKDLAYFSKAFAKQIHDFGITERAKYHPASYHQKRATTWVKSTNPPPEAENSTKPDQEKEEIEKRKVISTEILQQQSLNVLLLRHNDGQDVEHWLLDPGKEYGHWIRGGEIIKVLMMEASSAAPALSARSNDVEGETERREAMETLLLMANHQRMKILGLRNMSHGHHFGVSRVAEEAIKAYIYLNLLVAMRENGSGVCDVVEGSEGKERRNYMDCESYGRMLQSVAGRYDGDAQTLVHRQFFLGDLDRSFGCGEVPRGDLLEDLEQLTEYLKGVWRVMVTYDVVIREAGGDPKWEKECEFTIAYMFKVRYDMVT
jgi:hypothetical protein